ncbi:MAG TPA: YetF domain-containing protein [Allosphingosinicella sp.]|jgi:uncharacterized membrane protein YcaP (DUF421 family)
MELLDTFLGLGDGKDLNALQMGARAILIYVVTLAIIRLGKKRFMSRATAFDVIVGIVLGSIASRAITGNAPMFPAMTAAAVVMALHWCFSALAVRSGRFGQLIKGHDTIIVRNGEIDERALCATHMTSRDLRESLREQGVEDVAAVAEARLERDGSVSVIKRRAEPRIVSIDVAPGVQTVRVELA